VPGSNQDGTFALARFDGVTIGAIRRKSKKGLLPSLAVVGRLRALVLSLLALALIGGCATTRGAAGSRAVGVVSLEGIDQVLSLRVPDGVLAIGGPEKVVDQLDRLVDARVACLGPVGSGAITVRSFEILEAPDGMVPYLGRLVFDQSGVVLADETTGTPLALRSAELAALKRSHGDYVWLTGTIVGPQTILVAHWGVLIPAD